MHREKLVAAFDKIEDCAENRDVTGYIDAIFEFSFVSLTAANNPLLAEIMYDLMPSFRRLAFASFSTRHDDMKDNSITFKRMITCIEVRDVDLGEELLREYLEAEKNIAIKNLKHWPKSGIQGK